MATTSLYCPHCGQIDSVRKVSAIVSDGTSSSRYSGYGDGIGYSSHGMMVMDEIINLTGNSQTQLSQLLSPPIKPYERNFDLVWLCLALLGSFGFIVTMIGLSNITTDVANAIGALIFGLICLGIAALVFTTYLRKSKDEKIWFEGEIPRWEKAISKWHQLYFCYRCDGIFLPGEIFIVPSQYMMNFLYYNI